MNSFAHDQYFDPLKFISDMLMAEDEDWENNFFMFHDSLALRATEKSFYDALNNNNNLDDQNSNDHNLLSSNGASKGVPAAANGHQIVSSQMNPSWISGSLCETTHFDPFINLSNYDQFRQQNNKTGDYVKVVKKRNGDFTDNQSRSKLRRAIFQMEDVIDASLYN